MQHGGATDAGARGKRQHCKVFEDRATGEDTREQLFLGCTRRRAVCSMGARGAARVASLVLFATLFATTGGLQRAHAQQTAGKGGSAAMAMTPPQTNALPRLAAPTAAMSERGRVFYMKRFGVDELRVTRVSSGAMLEFRYLVVDPEKAKMLTDKKATPLLIDQKTRRKVGVPFMENIGTLRQSSTPVAGREYWMVFENPNRAIQAGSHVEITIGGFHVSGLVVE